MKKKDFEGKNRKKLFLENFPFATVLWIFSFDIQMRMEMGDGLVGYLTILFQRLPMSIIIDIGSGHQRDINFLRMGLQLASERIF